MGAGLLAQYAVIALAVAISVAVVMRKQFPNATRRMRGWLALWLMREGHAPWMQAFGRRIAPPARISGDACGGCNSCDPD